MGRALEKVSCQVMKMLEQLPGEALSLPVHGHVSELFRKRVFQLSQASRQPWCLLAFLLQSHEGLRAGVTQLSGSQIPDPQENW